MRDHYYSWLLIPKGSEAIPFKSGGGVQKAQGPHFSLPNTNFP